MEQPHNSTTVKEVGERFLAQLRQLYAHPLERLKRYEQIEPEKWNPDDDHRAGYSSGVHDVVASVEQWVVGLVLGLVAFGPTIVECALAIGGA